jgi:hypothetical protein
MTINNVTVSRTVTYSSELVQLNKDVAGAVAGKSSGNILFMAQKLSLMLIDQNQQRLATKLKDATSNLNGLTAMNQLNEDRVALKALRANGKIKDDDKMTAHSTDTANMFEKASKSGIAFSTEEAANWKAGNITSKDIETLESRIKTKQDAFSNTSQADNMELQKFNTLIGQFTNMGMTFLDEFKKQGDRIWR